MGRCVGGGDGGSWGVYEVRGGAGGGGVLAVCGRVHVAMMQWCSDFSGFVCCECPGDTPVCVEYNSHVRCSLSGTVGSEYPQ